MIEHRTLDSGRLAPYPNMTDDELDDFERWAAEQDRESVASATILFLIIACAAILALLALLR